MTRRWLTHKQAKLLAETSYCYGLHEYSRKELLDLIETFLNKNELRRKVKPKGI